MIRTDDSGRAKLNVVGTFRKQYVIRGILLRRSNKTVLRKRKQK